MLQFNGLAGLPSYLQRSCYIPQTSENTLQNRPSWKCNIFTA